VQRARSRNTSLDEFGPYLPVDRSMKPTVAVSTPVIPFGSKAL
jgi:hypothetical protein